MKLYFFALLLLLFQSCTKELKLPDTKRKKQITVMGELIANEKILLRIGETVPINATASYEPPKDMVVTLQDENGTAETLSGARDNLTAILYNLPFRSDTKITAKKRYQLNINSASLGVANAQIAIPSSFTSRVVRLSDTVYKNNQVKKVDIEILDNSEENFYMIEIRKESVKISGIDTLSLNDRSFANIYTSDYNTENLKTSNDANAFKRILLRDVIMNSSTYSTHIYISKNELVSSEEGYQCKLTINIKSVTKEYYDYLRDLNLYFSSNNFSAQIPANAKTNLTNGLGIVGGVSQNQYHYIF